MPGPVPLADAATQRDTSWQTGGQSRGSGPDRKPPLSEPVPVGRAASEVAALLPGLRRHRATDPNPNPGDPTFGRQAQREHQQFVLLLRHRPAKAGGVTVFPASRAAAVSCAAPPVMLPGREERPQLAAALRSRPVMLLTASAVLGSAAIAAAALTRPPAVTRPYSWPSPCARSPPCCCSWRPAASSARPRAISRRVARAGRTCVPVPWARASSGPRCRAARSR